MSVQVSPEIRIVPFDRRYANDFARLNYAWIRKYYEVEEHDRELLDHAEEQIINRGGEILFAIDGDSPVGTVALIKIDDNAFELAKMAVAPEQQGNGIGRLLLLKCIEYSRNVGKSEIILESNTRQQAAIHLYRSLGFIEVPLDPNSAYTRANIRMRLALSPSEL